jgi:hypothetical protein
MISFARRLVLFALFALLVPMFLFAQDAPKFSVFGGYNYLRPETCFLASAVRRAVIKSGSHEANRRFSRQCYPRHKSSRSHARVA